MAISEYKNGHFEEIRAWLQILEIGSNFTIFYLSFDTHWKFLDLISMCALRLPSNLSAKKAIIGIQGSRQIL